MRALRGIFGIALALAALTALAAAPAHAQARARNYSVSSDRAMDAARAVLQRQGYELVRVVREPDTQVIYYRLRNNGRGDGKGSLERIVIRTIDRRVVFEDVPASILADLDYELKL